MVQRALSESVVPIRNENRVWRQYMKGIVIEPGLALNETGAEFLLACDGTRTLKDITQEMSDQYDIPFDECLTDLAELCQDLLDRDIIRLVEKGE